MKADDELRSLEEKIYHDYNQDGALITDLGIMFMWMGAWLALRPVLFEMFSAISLVPTWFMVYVPIFSAAILGYLMIWLWRRWITYPRLGYTKFAASRKIPRNTRVRTFLLFIILIIAFNFSMRYSLKLISAIDPLLADYVSTTGSMVGIGMAVVGVILGLKRMWMMVVPMLALIWLAAYIHVSQGWVILLAGLLLVGLGLERLRRFLRDRPLQVNINVQ